MIENLEKMPAIEESSSEKGPRDKYNIVIVMFYLMGTLITPCTFFSTASDYWMYKFRNTSEPYDPAGNRTSLQAQFLANFTTVTSVFIVVAIVFATIFLKKISLHLKIKCSLVLNSIMFVATLILAVCDTDDWQYEFYILSLVVGTIVAWTGATYLISVFTILKHFPPHYLAAGLTGQALIGIITAVLQIICLAIGSNSENTALLYFTTGLVLLLFTLSMYLLMCRTSTFYKYHASEEVNRDYIFKFTKKDLIALLKQAKLYYIALVVLNGVSPMVSPGLISLVVSENPVKGPWENKYFVPVITYLGHHVFDFIGREASVRFKGLQNIKVVLFLTAIRFVFIPIFMFCNAQPRHLPVVFNHDAYYITFVIILTFSHGYLMNKIILGLAGSVEKSQFELMLLVLLLVMMLTQAACSVLGNLFVNLL